jgi:hypothetical protein
MYKINKNILSPFDLRISICLHFLYYQLSFLLNFYHLTRCAQNICNILDTPTQETLLPFSFSFTLPLFSFHSKRKRERKSNTKNYDEKPSCKSSYCQSFFPLNSLCFWHKEISAEAVTDVLDVELKKLVTLASDASSRSVQMWT